MSDFFSLGSVQYSILEPKDFLELPENKGKWVLMDGQNIHGSDLWKRTQMDQVPDGRGVFIRSMNCPKDKDEDMSHKGDPEVGRAVGTYQKDSLESHTHSITNLGIYQALLENRGFSGAEMTQFNANQGLRNIATMIRNEPTGGSETRPRNIALYLYIKIYN